MRYVNAITKGLLALSLIVSFFLNFFILSKLEYGKLFLEVFLKEISMNNFGEAGFIYVVSFPLVLLIGLILGLIKYRENKKIWHSFVLPGYLNLLLILLTSGWYGTSIHLDGIGLLVLIGMSCCAYFIVSFIQLSALFFVDLTNKMKTDIRA